MKFDIFRKTVQLLNRERNKRKDRSFLMKQRENKLSNSTNKISQSGDVHDMRINSKRCDIY